MLRFEQSEKTQRESAMLAPLYNRLAVRAENNRSKRKKNQNKTGLEALPESKPKTPNKQCCS